jgi:hypothetical protein
MQAMRPQSSDFPDREHILEIRACRRAVLLAAIIPRQMHHEPGNVCAIVGDVLTGNDH